MEIADARIQVGSLDVTDPAVGIQEFGLVKEDVEMLCLTSTILCKRYDIFQKNVFPQTPEKRNDAVSAASMPHSQSTPFEKRDSRRVT